MILCETGGSDSNEHRLEAIIGRKSSNPIHIPLIMSLATANNVCFTCLLSSDSRISFGNKKNFENFSELEFSQFSL